MKRNMFVKVVVGCTTGLMVLFAASCKQNVNGNCSGEQISHSDTSLARDENEIQVGRKIENPFSMKNRQAEQDVEANYYYFRVRTNVLEGIEYIKSVCGDLNVIPYDVEVIQGGSEYSENLGDENHSPWYYYTLPVEIVDSFDSADYEVEILDEMYLDEEALEELNSMEEGEEAPEETENARLLWNNWKRVNPSGYVYVYDEVEKDYKPVPNVRVTITQWCFTHSEYTDSNGKYSFSVKFSTLFQNNALVTVWFENDNEDVMHSGNISTSYYTQGHKNVGDLKGNNIKIKKGTDAHKYATIFRAAELYRRYIRESDIGVTQPQKLRIWMNPNDSSGITLMGDNIIGDTADLIAIFIGLCKGGVFTGAVTTDLLCSYLPDLIIGCKNYIDEDEIEKTSTEIAFSVTFHEMAHASHYESLGFFHKNAYWGKEYSEMVLGWCSQILKGQNPNKNCYNEGKSQLVCHIESWGYFMEDYLMNRHYKNMNTVKNYLDYLQDPNVEHFSFFYNQSYYKMIESGYSINQIFKIYTNYKVKTKDQFITTFIKEYNLNDKEQVELHEMF
ncbi:MAG: hypothetical protein MJ188_06750 [Treponema sp.]|nr:hypothetical protein [Treponema sp.]